MQEYELSVIIPARCEEFLKLTIDDILKNKRAKTEIIAVLDGEWANPPIPQHPDVNVIYVPEAIGQRAAQNLGVRLSKAKFVCKLDAHCAWDEGYDEKMIKMFKEVGDDVTMVGVMRNLHAFDWKCYHCGRKWYQDNKPENCTFCFKGDRIKKKMIWQPRRGTYSQSYCFNAEPRFTYFEAWKHREPYITDKKEKGYTESMSLQGSCFMTTRENYWKKELCDETLGNWGGQGIEVACKTWLSGGRVIVNHNTWYAHLFRTKADFSFPWPVSGRDQHRVKQRVKDQLWGKKYTKAIHPVSWLVEKFWPIPGWTEKDLLNLKNANN